MQAAPVREGTLETSGGVRLFHRTMGMGAETVVVLHGGPGFTMDYLAEDMRPLARRHTLLFYDQRGTGRSSLVTDAAALDAQRFVDDLEALRTHFGLERFTLLGHSWGAAVAALYAMRHPERLGALIIVGAIPLRHGELIRTFETLSVNRPDGERTRLVEARDAWLADPGSATACRAYYELWFLPFYGDRAAAGRSKGDFCAGSPDALRNKIQSVDRYTVASLGEYDWRAPLRAVRAPALVIHGTSDPIGADNAREWSAALPNSRLLLMEGVGHFPYVEAPDRFFAGIDDFLRGRRQG